MPERAAVAVTAECAHPAVSLAPVLPRSAAPRSRQIPNPITPTPRGSGKRSRAASPAMQPGLPYPRLTPGGGLDLGPLLVAEPSAASGCARPAVTTATSYTPTCPCMHACMECLMCMSCPCSGAPTLATHFCGSFAYGKVMLHGLQAFKGLQVCLVVKHNQPGWQPVKAQFAASAVRGLRQATQPRCV